MFLFRYLCWMWKLRCRKLSWLCWNNLSNIFVHVFLTLEFHNGEFSPSSEGWLFCLFHLDLQVFYCNLIVVLNLFQVHIMILLLTQIFCHTGSLWGRYETDWEHSYLYRSWKARICRFEIYVLLSQNFCHIFNFIVYHRLRFWRLDPEFTEIIGSNPWHFGLL